MVYGPLIAKPAVVEGDAGDALDHLSSFGAPAVSDRHLTANQPPAAVIGSGTDEFDAADPERDAGVGPDLRDEV